MFSQMTLINSLFNSRIESRNSPLGPQKDVFLVSGLLLICTVSLSLDFHNLCICQILVLLTAECLCIGNNLLMDDFLEEKMII